MEDFIEQSIEINAAASRVWHALTDYKEFGEWFKVKVEGPFIVGEKVKGHMTWPGYQHLQWQVTVKEIVPTEKFSLHLAPLRGRFGKRLFERDAYTGRIYFERLRNQNAFNR